MAIQRELWVTGETRDHAKLAAPAGYIVTGRSIVKEDGTRVWYAVWCESEARLAECQKLAQEQRWGGPKGSDAYYAYMRQQQAESVAARKAAETAPTVANPISGTMVLAGVLVLTVGGYLAYHYLYKKKGD